MFPLVTPLLGFAAGVLLGSGDTARSREDGRGGDARLAAALHGLLVLGPSTAALLGQAPEWSFAYLATRDQLGFTTVALLPCLSAASTLAGCLAAQAARISRLGAALRWAAPPAALALTLVLAAVHRLGVDASTLEFRQGFQGRALLESPLALLVLGHALVVLASTAWLVGRFVSR